MEKQGKISLRDQRHMQLPPFQMHWSSSLATCPGATPPANKGQPPVVSWASTTIPGSSQVTSLGWGGSSGYRLVSSSWPHNRKVAAAPPGLTCVVRAGRRKATHRQRRTQRWSSVSQTPGHLDRWSQGLNSVSRSVFLLPQKQQVQQTKLAICS